MIIIISIYLSLLGALLFLLYKAKKLNEENNKLYKEEKRKREGGVK